MVLLAPSSMLFLLLKMMCVVCVCVCVAHGPQSLSGKNTGGSQAHLLMLLDTLGASKPCCRAPAQAEDTQTHCVLVLRHSFRGLGESSGVTWRNIGLSVWRPGFWLWPWLGVHLILLEGAYCFTETPCQFMCLPVTPKSAWEVETGRNLNFSMMPQFLRGPHALLMGSKL